ncbi:MAG: TolC family protein [Bacteroidia bacterium]
MGWLSLWMQVALSLEEVYQKATQYHPLLQIAQRIPAIAQAQYLSAQSVWDPYLQGSTFQKDFKSQRYFSFLYTDIKIPVYNGIHLKASYEKGEGPYLNPERYTSESHLLSVGIQVPLLQGLWMDYRRFTTRKAQLYLKLSLAQRELMRNDVYLEIAQDYWNWYQSFFTLQVYRALEANAYRRLEGVLRAFQQGEASAYDTLQAHVEWQSRQVQRRRYEGEYAEKALHLHKHLWDTTISPQAFLATYVPAPKIPQPNLSPDSLLANHPKLQILQQKYQLAELHLRWARWQLLPILNAEYNFLQTDEMPISPSLQTNYKWGLSWAMPLYLRQARGQAQEAQKEKQNLQAEIDFFQRALYNKFWSLRLNIDSLGRALETQEKWVQNAQRLLELENQRFRLGESDLFILNRIEREALQALIARYELYARLGVTWARWYHALAAW